MQSDIESGSLSLAAMPTLHDMSGHQPRRPLLSLHRGARTPASAIRVRNGLARTASPEAG
jgi:hypothetical protein